jgi:soluble lytic murein transglycosylase-like protein
VNIQRITWAVLGWAMGLNVAAWALPEGSLDPEVYAQRRAQYAVRDDLSYRTVAADVEKYRGVVLELLGSVRGRVDVSQQVVFILRTPHGESVHLKSTAEKPPVSTGMTVKALARVPATGLLRELELLAIVPYQPAAQPPPTASKARAPTGDNPAEAASGGDQSESSIPGYVASFQSPPAPPQLVSRTRSVPQSQTPKPPASPSQFQRRPSSPSRGRTAAPSRAPTATPSEVAQVAAVIRAYNPRVPDAERQAIALGIVGYSRMFGLRWEFLTALVIAESNFNRTAVSSAGALGLGQLMPGTAAGLGVADPFDINQNLYGSARYIRAQLDRYAHHPPNEQFALALAAYNAGPGAVAKYGGVPPYTETINYIYRVAQVYTSLCPETRGRR